MNKVKLIGNIQRNFEYVYSKNEQKYYSSVISIKRKKDYYDDINIMLSESLITDINELNNNLVCIEGKVKTKNTKSKNVNVYVFVENLIDNLFCNNELEISGFICKKPTYRLTPNKKEISDVILAVNDESGENYYLPCIAWDDNARYSSTLSIGNQVKITGRIQSREYDKIVNNNVIKKIAYEISIKEIELI